MLHPLQANSTTPPVEWRAPVAEADITDLRLIEATTHWRGEKVAVAGASQSRDTLFAGRDEAPRPETSEPVCTAVPSTLSALSGSEPVHGRAVPVPGAPLPLTRPPSRAGSADRDPSARIRVASLGSTDG
jgi:hypothetical protein